MAIIDKVDYLHKLCTRTMVPVSFSRGLSLDNPANNTEHLYEIATSVPELLDAIVALRSAVGEILQLEISTADAIQTAKKIAAEAYRI